MLHLPGTRGAAFRLEVESPQRLAIDHPLGTIEVRAGAPYATVSLAAAVTGSDVRAAAWTALQEGLDVLAARQRIAISTRSGDQEFLMWSPEGSGIHLTCVDTSVMHWKSEITLITQGGSATQEEEPRFVHHPALRFYRLSQVSVDLFDAFRNAYLALEVLISDVSPKARGESELSWLKRVVRESFAGAVPSGMDADSSLDVWYRFGRNHIFHAKTGETFFAPLEQGREEIQGYFEGLTLFLVALLQRRLGASLNHPGFRGGRLV